MKTHILITGAGGYIGRQLAARLLTQFEVTGIDLRSDLRAGFPLLAMDIRDPALASFMANRKITHVVHLAAVLEDSGDRQRDYDIDVNGTRNVLVACVNAGVRHITVTSSGAAYGYYADNPEWLTESCALRGNPEFAYSHHKRLVEEMLADYRRNFPELSQLVLRVGTVLGEHTNNLITNLFLRKKLITIRGSAAPFVFIWDQDLVSIIEKGVLEESDGIFNVAGDGCLAVSELANILHKPVMSISAPLLKSILAIGKLLRVGRYGPNQVNFLRYRPVLDNRSLKSDFGYVPEKTSKQAFEFFVNHARNRGSL